MPYVVSRKVVGLADTAAAFGITEQQLVDDLNLLWCVELRSPDPYCPIDLSYEGGEIEVSQAESIDRPLRLGVDEASALLVALRMLAEVPSLDRSALSRTIAKLEMAAGAAGAASAQLAVQVDDRGAGRMLARLRDAVQRGRRLHLSYYVPGRDEATERDVDPMRLLVVEGRTYLEAWCLRAEAVRLFRLDRVLALTVLDLPAAVPPDAQSVDVDRGLFRPSPDDVEVVLELSPLGRWVAEYYPCQAVSELATAGCGSACAPRTPAGSGGWRCGSARTAGSSPRRSLAAEVRQDAAAALAQYD